MNSFHPISVTKRRVLSLASVLFWLAYAPSSVQAGEAMDERVGESIGVIDQVFADMNKAFEQLKREYPDIDIPPALKQWMEGFSAAPFDTHSSVAQDLRSVSTELSSEFSRADLNDEAAAMMAQFTSTITGISQNLSAAMAGAEHQPANTGLDALTRTHDANQADIDRVGKELAAHVQALDMQGLLKVIEREKAKYYETAR